MNKRLFSIAAVAMLLVPAVVYLVVAAHNGRLNLAYLSAWFLPNYGYMAAPHFIAIIVGLAIKARQISVLGTLAVLNFALIAFQLYVLFSVPPRESGLAWVLYIPISATVLLVVPLFFFCNARRKGPPIEKQLA